MTMNEAEQLYLLKFRELTSKRSAIIRKIADLRKICETLKDWQKTAGELSNPGFGSLHIEWSDESLAGLTDLRLALKAYHLQAEGIEKTWKSLSADEKVGLADPGTLRLTS